MNIDFKHNPGLVFWEFYDSIFEFIDNSSSTKSLLAFLVVAKIVKTSIINSAWFEVFKPNFAKNAVLRQ